MSDLVTWLNVVTEMLEEIDPMAFDMVDLDRAREELRTASQWREALDQPDRTNKVVTQNDSS